METIQTTAAVEATTPPDYSDYQSINEFIYEAETMLTNAQLEDVLPLLEKRRYTKKVLEAKLAELEALRTLNQRQKEEYGEQHDATEAFLTARAGLFKTYMKHLKLARMALRDNTGAKTALGLSGERKRSKSGYLAQAQQFYDGALNSKAYQAALDTKGIEKEELEAAKAALKGLKGLADAQHKETGEAQAATAARDVAYDKLYAWVRDFKATAAIALEDTPGLMAKMGLK